MGVTVPVGDMIQGRGNMVSVPSSIPTSGDHFSANVFFTARNGGWTELLRVVQVSDGWARAIRVTGQFTSLKKEIPVCETIDPKFPRTSQLLDEFKPIDGPKPPPCL